MAQEKQHSRGKRTLGSLRDWVATFPRYAIQVAASVAIVLATFAAIVLALHIVFVVFKTNPNNGIVTFVDGFADTLAWQFKDLFTYNNDSLRVFINYGIAAVAYLVAGRILAGLLRRLG